MRSHVRTAEEDSQMEAASGLVEELKSGDATLGAIDDSKSLTGWVTHLLAFIADAVLGGSDY